jgi:ABC-2 type transport system ATP-binding protein
MSIIVKDITKIYGTQKALDAVSFEVKPGGIVGLLGPNGAGKSTLMKIITCFIPPTSGEASVMGYDIFEQSIDVRRITGYLPENNPLYLDLYVREFLDFIAGIHQIDKKSSKRVEELIGLVGLQTEQHKKIGALSKGYRQRVGLAQALLHDPKVLILDEPTSGLDPNQLLEIRQLIREISKEKTIMLSTHIMQEVEAICDRVIIINKGKIVADNSTANLQHLASSGNVTVVEFNVPVEGSKLLTIAGVQKVVNPSGKGDISAIWHLSSSAGSDIRPAVFQYAVDNKLTVLSLSREELRLEEIFQGLTKN